jgi:pilus assembly protein CpaB
VLAPGKRAISIQANEIVGVAGYVHPGSRVDIMVNTREGQEKQISKIILTNLLVLAAAQDDKRDQTKPKVVSTVTLEVDPQQAEIVDLARSIGTLSMVLRNPLDTVLVKTTGVTRDDVFGLLGQPVPPGQVAASPAVIAASKPETVAAPAKPKVRAVAKASVSKSPPAAQTAESVEIIRGVQKAVSNF